MICNNKTICFGIKETVFSTIRDSLLQTKTICFAVMMVYDAFVKRVIYANIQIFNQLASIVMLLMKISHFCAPSLIDKEETRYFINTGISSQRASARRLATVVAP